MISNFFGRFYPANTIVPTSSSDLAFSPFSWFDSYWAYHSKLSLKLNWRFLLLHWIYAPAPPGFTPCSLSSTRSIPCASTLMVGLSTHSALLSSLAVAVLVCPPLPFSPLGHPSVDSVYPNGTYRLNWILPIQFRSHQNWLSPIRLLSSNGSNKLSEALYIWQSPDPTLVIRSAWSASSCRSQSWSTFNACNEYCDMSATRRIEDYYTDKI